MTKDDLINAATPLLRHGLTLMAGVLSAHGLAGGDQLVAFGSSGLALAASLGWSFIEKNAILGPLFSAAPASQLEDLAATVARFKAQGANPMLVNHLAQGVLAIAQTELFAAHPELGAQVLGAAQPAPAPEPVAPAPEPVTHETTYEDGVVVNKPIDSAPQPIPAFVDPGAEVLSPAPTDQPGVTS